jgi:hypothetical protein
MSVTFRAEDFEDLANALITLGYLKSDYSSENDADRSYLMAAVMNVVADLRRAREAEPSRYLVEIPDTYAVARWPRSADVPTIVRCILGTLEYEPHTSDLRPLQNALRAALLLEPSACEGPDADMVDAHLRRGGHDDEEP